MADDLTHLRSEFIEKIGLIAQTDGLPRIAGRLLGLMIWDGETVSFSDLAHQLQVSRGSISTASRILEDRRLIKRVAKPGERQDYFQLSERPYASLLAAIQVVMERAQEDIDQTLEQIPESEAGVRDRVSAYSKFYALTSKALGGLIDEV